MGSEAVDRDLSGDNDFANHLAFAFVVAFPFHVVDHFHAVLTGKTAHGEDGVQPVRIGTRIRVGHHLSAGSGLGGIGDSPFDLRWIEWFFERRHQPAHFFVGVFFPPAA